MEVMSAIEAPRGIEQGGDMKSPKRTMSMPVKSVESMRQKRRDGVGGVSPASVLQAPDYGLPMRTGQMHATASYINEVSMSG